MKINFTKDNGLVPVIIQDSYTNAVLMLGYMNQEALEKTRKTRLVWFWSRSKKRLWKKGETSGNVLNVNNIATDCDSDTLLVTATPSGPICHTLKKSCFSIAFDSIQSTGLEALFEIIIKRKSNMPKSSYTASLFREGKEKIREKIVEEAVEVVIASKLERKQRIIEEVSDVLYHLFVLLVAEDVTFIEVENELQKRSKK